MERYATVVWHGPGKDGKGLISTQSAVIKEIPFSFSSRFISADGTNPEELMAAAFAACFIMKLNFLLEATGFRTDTAEVTAFINFERGLITGLRLLIKAEVPGIPQQQLHDCVQDAKANCPIGQIMNLNTTAELPLNE